MFKVGLLHHIESLSILCIYLTLLDWVKTLLTNFCLLKHWRIDLIFMIFFFLFEIWSTHWNGYSLVVLGLVHLNSKVCNTTYMPTYFLCMYARHKMNFLNLSHFLAMRTILLTLGTKYVCTKYCIVVNKYISLIFLIVAWPKKLLNNEIYFVFLYILWYNRWWFGMPLSFWFNNT